MIAFKCSACDRTLKIGAEHAGKLVKCPCSAQVRVPQPNSKPAQPAEQSEKIPTRCPSCNRQFRVPSSSVGKTLKCVCGNKFACSPVSQTPAAPAAPAGAVAGQTASEDPFGGSDPLGSSDPFGGSDSSMWDDMGSTSASASPAAGASGFPSQPAGNFQAPAAPYQAPASAYQAPASPNQPTAAVSQSSRDTLALASAGLQHEQQANQDNSLYESRFFNPTVLGGLGMMGLAAVWFIGGLFVGYIFFYPPILFLFGIAGVIKGLLGEHG